MQEVFEKFFDFLCGGDTNKPKENHTNSEEKVWLKRLNGISQRLYTHSQYESHQSLLRRGFSGLRRWCECT